MNDDEFLRDLAQLADEDEAAEQSRFDSRWDALCAGTLPAQEEATLRARAARSEEYAEAYEVFLPFDDAYQQRLVARLREEMLPAGGRGAGSSDPGQTVRRRRRHRGRRWVLAAAVLVAALGMLRLARPELPPYSLAWEGGLQDLRSETATGAGPALRLAPGIAFTFVLTPERQAGGALGVRAFAVRGESWRPWPEVETLAEIAPSGAVRVAGRYGRDLELTPGEWTLLLMVGRPQTLPGWEEVRAVSEREAGDWRLLRLEVEIVEPGAP